MGVLSKNISANLLSSVWSTLLALLLTPVYIRFLGVESYGLIGFYFSWVAILGILDTGISATAMREIAWYAVRPEGNEKIPNLLFSLEIIYWGMILVLGLVFLVGASVFGAGWFQSKALAPAVVRDALMLMAVSLVVQVPSGLYSAGLMGLQHQVECSGLLALFGTLRGIGAVVVLCFIVPDIRLFFVWQIVVSVLQTGVMRGVLWYKINSFGRIARFSSEFLGSVKHFAGGMILITALSIVITQMDKMILSRMVSLEVFGFYMLGWAVASSLTRVATPLIQAFSPRFTELVSRGEDAELGKQVRLASQLMSMLILPPTALIMVFAKPVLLAWTGDVRVASGTAPVLTVMVVGTALGACAYPALSVLYSRKELRPVVITCLASLVVLLPLLIMAISCAGIMGAAFCWVVYGLIMFVAYQVYGLRGISHTGFFLSIARDFVAPCVAAFAVAGMSGYLLNGSVGRGAFISLFALVLFFGWFATALACTDLNKIVMNRLVWKTWANL